MSSKFYLSQTYRLDQRINSKLEQVEALNELATKCTATLSGMPRSPNRATDTMADAVAKLIDLQTEINNDVDALVELKRDIVALIKRVNDTELQTILEKRYLCFMPWEQIAVDLRYSIHHLYKLHNAALENCDRLLKHDT